MYNNSEDICMIEPVFLLVYIFYKNINFDASESQNNKFILRVDEWEWVLIN